MDLGAYKVPKQLFDCMSCACIDCVYLFFTCSFMRQLALRNGWPWYKNEVSLHKTGIKSIWSLQSSVYTCTVYTITSKTWITITDKWPRKVETASICMTRSSIALINIYSTGEWYGKHYYRWNGRLVISWKTLSAVHYFPVMNRRFMNMKWTKVACGVLFTCTILY